MGGGQLQVVPLFRVGDRPSRQKSPTEEGHAAAGLLQDSKVDVQGHGLSLRTVGLADGLQLLRVLNGKNMLSIPLWKAVKGDSKGLFEQQGQSLGKGVVFGDDPHLPAGKGVAVQQHPVGLRLGAALAVQLPPAQLIFYLASKGHGVHSSMI